MFYSAKYFDAKYTNVFEESSNFFFNITKKNLKAKLFNLFYIQRVVQCCMALKQWKIKNYIFYVSDQTRHGVQEDYGGRLKVIT